MINYSEKFITFTQDDIDTFNRCVGDENPIHSDEEFCKNTIFGKPIVPGLLTSGVFGGILGTNLPEGAVLLGIELKFTAPVFVGEKVRVVVMFKKQRQDKPIITFRLVAYCRDKIAIEGEAIIKT